MGLRLGETLGLEVGDIDSERMKVHVRQGKNRKDRFVTLPDVTLQTLRRYWCSHRHPNLLFPRGRTVEKRHSASHCMDRGGVQKAFKAILSDCGIRKLITRHSLRHCYGANLVELGVNLRSIQQEMGHDNPATTALYTQLTEVTQTDTDKRINRLVSRLRIKWGE